MIKSVKISARILFCLGILSGPLLFSAAAHLRGGPSTLAILPDTTGEEKESFEDCFLLSNEVEKDQFVCALLASSGEIGDPEFFWRKNVAKYLSRALNDDIDKNLLCGAANELKDRFLGGYIESSGFSTAIKNEIKRFKKADISYVIAFLPPAFEFLFEGIRLSAAEKASIRFIFKDKILQCGREDAFDFAVAFIASLVSVQEPRHIFSDPRIHGLAKELVTEDIAEPKSIALSSQSTIASDSLISNLSDRLADIRASQSGAILFALTNFSTQEDSVALSAEAKGELCCSLCCADDAMLYQNVCPCNPTIPLCEACIRKSTLENIVGGLRVVAAEGFRGPAHVVFSLQLPRCSFCKRGYYEEQDYDRLGLSLPPLKRQALIVADLAAALEKYSYVERENIMVRLIATNCSYRGIVLHNATGELLLPSELALQIFNKDAAMRDSIVEPFTDANTWKR